MSLLIRLALAGILALPSLVVSIVVLPLQIILSIPSVWLLLWSTPKTTNASNDSKDKNNRRHVIITGGSSGIGKGVALEAARNGDKVTILARDKTRLAEAKDYIQDVIQKEQGDDKNKTIVDVSTISVDVTNYSALDKVAKELFSKDKNNDSTIASIHLVICAGIAEPNHFHVLEPDAFARQVQLNLLGSTYTAHAFLPYLVDTTTQTTLSSSTTTKPPCSITFCSSQAGQTGVYGYGAYSPTKFALRGLAEVLAMEYYHKPIHIQVAYPPDTNSPGYVNENKTKPHETIIVSGGVEKTSQAADPNLIGHQLYQAVTSSRPKTHVYFDMDGFILATLCSGFSPVTTLWDGVAQVTGMQICRWITLFYLIDWKRMLTDYHKSKHGDAADTDKQD